MKLGQVLALAAVIFVGFFDIFAQFPVVAPYARSVGAAPSVIGLIVAIYSLTNLAGNLAAGYLIDRVGRKQLLVCGLALSGVAVWLYAAAGTPEQLLAVRAFHGLAAAILAPAAFTSLGDLFPFERRGGVMGAGGMVTALAAMVAPAVSGVVRDRWGFGAVFGLVGALLFGAAVLAQTVIAEAHPRREEEQPSSGVFKAVLARRALVVAYVLAVALSFGLGTLVSYLPLHLADLRYAGSQTGLAFSAFAVVAMLTMSGPILWRRRGAKRRVVPAGVGLVVTGLALLLLPLRADIEAIVGAMGLYGLGFGLIFPAANAQVADATEPNERGTAFGVFYAFYSAGVILGAFLSGLVASGRGGVSPFHLGAAVAFPSAAVVLWMCRDSKRVQRL